MDAAKFTDEPLLLLGNDLNSEALESTLPLYRLSDSLSISEAIWSKTTHSGFRSALNFQMYIDLTTVKANEIDHIWWAIAITKNVQSGHT